MRITVDINDQVLKNAKVQAAAEELTLSGIVEKSLIAYIPKQTISFVSMSEVSNNMVKTIPYTGGAAIPGTEHQKVIDTSGAVSPK